MPGKFKPLCEDYGCYRGDEVDALRAEVERLRAERDDALSIIPAHALVQQNADLLREAERLRDQVIRLQSQIKDWHDQNRPLCEVKGCKRMATGEAERSGVWWRVCEKHHVAVESTGADS